MNSHHIDNQSSKEASVLSAEFADAPVTWLIGDGGECDGPN